MPPEKSVPIDKVFKDLVQSMSHMDTAVGVWRSIVESVDLLGVFSGEPLVGFLLCPETLDLWLRLRLEGRIPWKTGK